MPLAKVEHLGASGEGFLEEHEAGFRPGLLRGKKPDFGNADKDR